MKSNYISAKAKMLVRSSKISKPPVPVKEIIKSNGITLDTSTIELSKTYAIKNNMNRIILHTKYNDDLQERVELAKSLGVLCLGRGGNQKILYGKLGERPEKELVYFAQELLVPGELLEDLLTLREMISLARLQEIFMVPERMIMNKINNL